MSSPTKTKDFLRKSRENMQQRRDELRKSGDVSEEGSVPISIKVSPKKKKQVSRTPTGSEAYRRVTEMEEEHIYITLQCKDGDEVVVPDYIAFHSGLIKRIFDGSGVFREVEEQRVALPAFSGKVIEKIFAYSFEDFLLNEGHRHTSTARRRLFADDVTEEDEAFDSFSALAFGTPPNSLAGSLLSSTSASPPTVSGFAMISSSPPLAGFMPSKSPISGRTPVASPKKETVRKALPPRIVFAIEMDPEEVMEVVMACHYLDIPDLLETACKMVAANVAGLDSLEGVPPDVIHQIYSYLSPDELVEVEASELHKTAHPALNTSDLWMKAVEKRGWSPYDIALLNSYTWSNEVRESKLFLEDSAPNKPLTDSLTMELAEDFAGVNWKELYLQKAFHHRMASFTSGSFSSDSGGLESLEAFHVSCLPHLRTLHITPSFVQIADLRPLYFVERTPSVEYLNLSDHKADRALMQKLADVIHSGQLPKLRSLRLSRCALTDAAFAPLLAVLATTRLERLDLSENRLTDAALAALAQLLRDPRCPLKYLSLRDNQISSPYTDQINRRDAAKAKLDPERPCALGLVLDSLKGNSALTLLDLSYNNLNLSKVSVEQLQHFGENASLQYLLLNDNRLVWDVTSSEAFAHFIGNLPKNVAHVNLNYIGIDEGHVPVLVAALRARPSLRHLVLSDNSFGRDSCDALGQLLRENETLRSLNLANNSFLDSGARVLARHLELNKGLVSLRLERNRLGRAALDLVQSLLRAKTWTKLRALDLRANGVTGEVSDQIKALIVNHALALNVVMDFSD